MGEVSRLLLEPLLKEPVHIRRRRMHGRARPRMRLDLLAEELPADVVEVLLVAQGDEPSWRASRIIDEGPFPASSAGWSNPDKTPSLPVALWEPATASGFPGRLAC